MVAALMAAGTQFIARWIVNEQQGMSAVGYFHAAWTISNLYLGFILGAMGSDYFPRLSESANNNRNLVVLMNEQAHASFLLIGPLVLWTYILAPYVVGLLYSTSFSGTVDILRWHLLGDYFKVPAWVLGFVLTARGRGLIFFLAELLWSVLYLGSLSLGLQWFGLAATGAAFLLAHSVIFVFYWIVVKYTVGFAWTPENRALLCAVVVCVSVVLSFQSFTNGWAIQLLVTTGLSLFCVARLRRSLGIGHATA
jgi:PST family polysaccharide transporter